MTVPRPAPSRRSARPNFRYWRPATLSFPGALEFAEGRGPVVTAESLHFHDEAQAVLVFAGQRLIRLRGREHLLSAGDALWIPPDDLHQSLPRARAADPGEDRFLYAYLSTPLVQRLLPGPGFARAPRRLSPHQLRQAALLLGLLRDGEAGLGEPALAALLALFAGREADVGGEVETRPAAIAEAKAYLDRHFADPVSLEALAKAVGLSRFHVVRRFAAVHGLTPHAYLLRRRVNAAKALMRRGLPPAEVALACGFADQSHMGLHFRRLVGLTPGAYRRA